jgi:erythromycin esterase
MSNSTSSTATISDWIARDTMPFVLDSAQSLNDAVDKLAAALGDSVSLLGLGEPMHGAEEFLVFRTRLFQRLVEAHGYTAIAVESSFPRSRVVNEFVAGRCADSYDAIAEPGFSHGFGVSAANRELVEWMRAYNAASDDAKLAFYGFDSPTEMTHTDSPRTVLEFVLDYVAEVDNERASRHRERIEPLLGDDAAWENPAAMMDPSKSIGLSAVANELRLATEDLIAEMQMHQPGWVAQSNADRYREALHYAAVARHLLTYHAIIARASESRLTDGLGLRDAMMADNLAYILSRERRRTPKGGKVLAFAHNSHLKLGPANWQLGPHFLRWWPAGAQMRELLGPRYAVIGAAVGTAPAHGIGQPEPGTLEAHLSAAPGPARFVPTHLGNHVSAEAIAQLSTRTGSSHNYTYFPLTPKSLAEFDWLFAM